MAAPAPSNPIPPRLRLSDAHGVSINPPANVFTYKKFDIKVVRHVDLDKLEWPGTGEATHGSSLGGNLEYADLRRLSWAEAKRIFDLESQLIARIERATDIEAESESIDDYLYQSTENLHGLDLGVASTVACLSAAKCLPFTSCNAGAFGGSHREEHPLVAFFARKSAAELILESAVEADIGLRNGPGGCLIAYADDIRNVRSFAGSMLKRRRLFTSQPQPRHKK